MVPEPGEYAEHADPQIEQRPDDRCPTDSGDNDLTQELFFGLVAPLETDLDRVVRVLTELLSAFAYAVDTIRLSELIAAPGLPKLDKERLSPNDYSNRAIDGGNYVRLLMNEDSALAQKAISIIPERRATLISNGKRRRAIIFRSFKRPEEVTICRNVFGSLFYCIAINADEREREQRLARRINEHFGRPSDIYGETEAKLLIRRDSREDKKHGQKVSETFANADYFIRNDNIDEISYALKRLLDLIFGRPYISPTRSEVAMMHAQTAAFRSADLSRQVGAVITARDGHLLTTGCNEVPRPGGGEYWEDDLDDDRDFQVGYDFNDRKKRETEIEFLSQIDGIIIPSMLAKGVKSVYEDLESLGTFRGTRVDSLIEFGRAMHAEMAALTAASASAVSVKDADLYCTTFPCHMCTRLIISAGLRNVYYIEPYPKSAAIEMYGEHEIVVNPNMSSLEHRERRTSLQRDDKRVHFIAFEGVAPRRYGDLFNNAGKDRKNKRTGEVVNFHPLEAKPRHAPFVPVHTSAETKVRDSVQAQEAQLEQKPERDPQNQRNVPEVIRSGEIP